MKTAPLFLLLILTGIARAQVPPMPATPVEQTQVPVFTEGAGGAGQERVLAAGETVAHEAALANFRLRFDYQVPEDGFLSLRLHERRTLNLPGGAAGQWQTLDLQYEQLAGKPASFGATLDGQALVAEEVIEGSGPGLGQQGEWPLDRDFTAMVRFTSTGDGALFARCGSGKWEPDSKMLGLRGSSLFYDIGWLGAVSGRTKGLTDGKPHVAVVRSVNGRVKLFIDGKGDGMAERLTRPDVQGHEIKIGQGAEGFVGDLLNGTVSNWRYWERGLSDDEVMVLGTGKAEAVNTPMVNWSPPSAVATFAGGIAGVPTKITLTPNRDARIRHAWVQALGNTPHAGIISRWDHDSSAEGKRIYNSLCVTCHGSLTQEGSMPTSRHFQRDAFRNGNDPFRQFQTLTQGYGLMMPLPMFTPEQRYATLQYISETYVAPHNQGELFKVDNAYLTSLPLAMRTLEKPAVVVDDSRQFEKMDFGPVLDWTYQVSPGNIAYKGIAVRLDPGGGGISKGRGWLVYDHDTMQVATMTTGSFMDWKNVAFDGSHNTHCSLTGDRLFTNPAGPGWANPANGSWEDPRFIGRDGKRYGPLPREWMRYHGKYLHGQRVVQSYSIGGATVLDAPEMLDYGRYPVLVRALNINRSQHDLKLRIAPESDAIQVHLSGAEGLKTQMEGGFQILIVPASRTPVNFRLTMTRGSDAATLEALAKGAQLPLDLAVLTNGGNLRWPQEVITKGVNGAEDGPFATDVITHPEGADNPWQSWMRLTAFDFFPDGNRAAVSTWMGDVWIVEGIGKTPLGELKWRRVATGLFQPLGLKIVNGLIHVTCRDQIARLHDLNGDGETDFVECFNNDQQVTEHFHEFAMGLQADAQGNFYYAKSARHALPAVVAQHGTLLRVSADGLRTDILASGFRAANGVCLNPDGTFFVSDQEGHWMPKNRINLVRGKGPSEFFGNLFGYHDITDGSDGAMQQPVCWITNAFDRSPSELLWVPGDAKWGPLNGTLLNLSYGYGKIFTVPYETVNGQAQGGMCALPVPQFPTGVMRGRFHPGDGQFYGCGMFAWAGNQSQAGGFYRVRYTGKPALQPVGLHFAKGIVRVQFSDPLDDSAVDPSRYVITAWGLKRSANYGSQHEDEHTLEVTRAEVMEGRTLVLTVPSLHPTRGLAIVCKLKERDGKETERVIHGTIHGFEK